MVTRYKEQAEKEEFDRDESFDEVAKRVRRAGWRVTTLYEDDDGQNIVWRCGIRPQGDFTKCHASGATAAEALAKAFYEKRNKVLDDRDWDKYRKPKKIERYKDVQRRRRQG